MPGPESNPGGPPRLQRPSEVFLEELLPKVSDTAFSEPGASAPESGNPFELAAQASGLPPEGSRAISTAESASDRLGTPQDVISYSNAELNPALNRLIGHRKASDAELPIIDALGYARQKAQVAEELTLFETGSLNGEMSEAAKQALQEGTTSQSALSEALAEVKKYELLQTERTKVFEFEKILGDSRTAYVTELMKRPALRGRKQHQEKLHELESAYNTAFVNKLAAIMDIDPQHDKAPYAASEMRRIAEVSPDIEKFSGSQMFMLVDQLSREQLAKTSAIESLTNQGAKRFLNALKTSRPLRIVIGGAIWAGSLVATHKGILPSEVQFMGDAAKQVLPLVAGYVTGREVLAGVDDGVEKFRRSRQMKKDIGVLTADTFLTELSLRSVYGNIEYQEGQIAGRQAGTSQIENQQAVKNINTEFSQLQNEGVRGGKPYKADEILPYVADLLIRRKDQIDTILKSENPKEAFLQLSTEVIAADSKELTDKQQTNRAKRIAFKALAVGGSMFANNWVMQAQSMQKITAQPVNMAAANAS